MTTMMVFEDSLEERRLGLNPLNADSDSDGLDDGVELENLGLIMRSR